MRRRHYLGLLTAGITGLSGCSEISNITGPSKPGELVKTVNPHSSYFTKIELYDNGVAKITLKEDHGSYTRIALTHALHEMTWEQDGVPDEAYEIWDAPEFAGPITVDLKTPIQNNGPYPSQKFKLKLLESKDESVINMGQTSVIAQFTVPQSYLPEN